MTGVRGRRGRRRGEWTAGPSGDKFDLPLVPLHSRTNRLDLPASSNRRLAQVIIWMSVAILLADGLWAAAARTFGWYTSHVLFYVSLLSYLVAGWLAYQCGGLLLGAAAGAIVCIVDNLIGTYIAWLILPRQIDATLPSIPELAPMFAEAVVGAVLLGAAGGWLAMGVQRWRARRSSPQP